MSFQYYTKSLSELQEIANVISTNFAELVGCEEDLSGWSPAVAYEVCNKLSLSGSKCVNVSDQYIGPTTEDILSYRFSSDVNTKIKSIWDSVLNYDESIFNLTKLSSIKITKDLSTKDKLKLCANQSTDFDSTIYECLYNLSEIQYTEDYQRILLILLMCFTIRHEIFDFSIGKSSTLNTELLNDLFLNTVVENIKYEKHALNNSTLAIKGFETSLDFIQQQLTLLMKNCKQLKSYVLEYIK